MECTAPEWAAVLGLPALGSTVGTVANSGLSMLVAGCCTAGAHCTAAVDGCIVADCTVADCTVAGCTVADCTAVDCTAVDCTAADLGNFAHSDSSADSGYCCCSTDWHSASAAGSAADCAGFAAVDVAAVGSGAAGAPACAWAEVAFSRADCWRPLLPRTRRKRTREDGRRASS